MPRHDEPPAWLTRRGYSGRPWARRLWAAKRPKRPDPPAGPAPLPSNVVPFPGPRPGPREQPGEAALRSGSLR